MRVLRLAFIGLMALTALSAGRAPRLGIMAAAYPSHGLPAIEPVTVVTITNESSQDMTIDDTVFCIETASGTSGRCDLGEGTDWRENWFDRSSAAGAFTLGGGESRMFFGRPAAFYDRPMLAPKEYRLRVRLLSADVTSDPFTYTVDEPKGENRAGWLVMQQLPHDIATFVVPYYGDELIMSTREAHPASDYAKIAAYAFDRGAPLGNLAALLSWVQSYLTPGIPEAFDTDLSVNVAQLKQTIAITLACRGSLDEAELQAKQGKAVLVQLSSGSVYARAAAKAREANGPWSRGDLERYAAVTNGTANVRLKPIEPLLNCIVLNTNGTFTAWFGYLNVNSGILQVQLGL